MVFSAGDRLSLVKVFARPERAVADADDGGAPIALNLAKVIVAVVFCGYGGTALLWVIESGKSAAEIAWAVVLLAGLLSLQFFYFGRPRTKRHSVEAYAMLALQAGLAYLPALEFGVSWGAQATFLAGSVLLVLPPRTAWPAYVGVVASMGVETFLQTGSLRDIVYIVVNAATGGLFVYGLTRLGHLVTSLHEARGELAKTAVAHERLRFARNLHALLGSSLSAIAPKGELALRLLPENSERARQELTGILEIARRALADVRSMARLYRETSLDDEAGTLASLLASSNVDLRVDLDRRALPPSVRTSLATVLREGTAFMLRHHEVAQCEIVLRRQGDSVEVDLLYEADGTLQDVDGLAATASGLAGELSAEVGADGRSRVRITLPVTASPPEGPSADSVGEPEDAVPHAATRFAGALVVAVLTGLFVQAVLRLFYVPEVPGFVEFVLCTACMFAALVLQLAYFSRPQARLRSPRGVLLLGVQTLLVYVPVLQIQEPWAALPGFVAGSALLTLRPVLAWIVFAMIVGGGLGIDIGFGGNDPRDIGQNMLITMDIGLITYGLTWMARSVRRLRAVRRELAAAALAETRLRLARDLHDLLGLSLSAITLKCELAYRLIPRDPARARTVLAEMLEISRGALADVRSVAGGSHRMSLDEECRTTEALLTTAGLDVQMDLEHAHLSPEVGTVLAMVLREGVTNVLRHSKSEHCQVTIGKDDEDGVLLRIVNDAVPVSPQGDHWGSGIRNMSDRVAALGGVLTAGFEGGCFELSAHIPRS